MFSSSQAHSALSGYAVFAHEAGTTAHISFECPLICVSCARAFPPLSQVHHRWAWTPWECMYSCNHLHPFFIWSAAVSDVPERREKLSAAALTNSLLACNNAGAAASGRFFFLRIKQHAMIRNPCCVCPSLLSLSLSLSLSHTHTHTHNCPRSYHSMKEASLRLASLITSTATTTSAPLLLLFPSRSLSCASAVVALSSTCGRGLRSNLACWRKPEDKCCCCRTRRTTRSVAAQNLRHQECQQLGDLGDGGGNATTISLGGSNNNSGAFKRKASAAIAAADDDDDTQVVDRGDSWWAYLLLSANSRKTYVGVSSNVVRRCVCVCVCMSRAASTV